MPASARFSQQITNKRNPLPAAYTIHGQVLEIDDSAKYLGVHLDTRLTFNTYVVGITRRANCTRAFLSRNLSHCSQKVKEAAYTMYVRPSVEFASAAWAPHTQRNIRKVEQVQKSAVRFVVGDYQRTSSVSDMITSLNWPSLQNRRLQRSLVMMYKIYHDLVDISWKITLLHSYQPPEVAAPGSSSLTLALQPIPARSFLEPSGIGTTSK